MRSLSDAQPGDEVLRFLAGRIPMVLVVEKVEAGIIYTRGGWTFLAETGGEIDEAIGWDGRRTGSILAPVVVIGGGVKGDR